MSISARNVNLVLGDGDQKLQVLKNVSLDVQDGEFLAVVGPSGSGKSSLLAVLGGLRKPNSGEISIAGNDITRLKEKTLTKVRSDHIGFVFQFSNLVPSLNAYDQLLLTCHLRGNRPKANDKARAKDLLAEVGLQNKMKHRPGEMSGGERQRVGIARALMSHPDILLIDEPTSMLDHKRGHEIVDILKEKIAVHNIATLMVTHDKSMLSSTDTVLQMEDGVLSTKEE